MASSNLKLEPVVASDRELATLLALEDLLQVTTNGSPEPKLRVVSATGQEVELPESILRLLQQLVSQLAKGKGATIWSFHQPLRIGEAARLLEISRHRLVELLAEEEIPHTGDGWECQIRFDDLMAYKQKRDRLQKEGLAEIVTISEEAGLYSSQPAEKVED